MTLPIPVRSVDKPPRLRRPWYAPPWGPRGLAGGHGEASQARTAAWVNHGAWCAWCPFCPQCDLVVIGQERFVCSLCSNAAAGGRYVSVEWPSVELQQEARSILALRPVELRNWIPTHETLDQLRAENLENGVTVPGLR